MMHARVVRTERTTPHFVTVTVGGPELAEFDFLGLDQCVRVFLARPGQERLTMPPVTEKGWYPEYRKMADDVRPHVPEAPIPRPVLRRRVRRTRCPAPWPRGRNAAWCSCVRRRRTGLG